jgi:c-di-AMP phosphodiesterase-like protein
LQAQLVAFHAAGAKDNLLHFPLPMVVVSSNLEIVWYNSLFADSLAGGVSVFEKIIKEELARVTVSTGKIAFNVRIQQETLRNPENEFGAELSFDVVGKISHTPKNEDYSIVLYLIDRTRETHLERNLENIKAVACWLMVDNYDDLVKSLEHNRADGESGKAAAILTEIDEQINAWVKLLDGVAIRYEKDKYFIVFQHDRLQEQIDDKFNFFKIIEEINEKRRIPISISVGIGDSGATLQQSSLLADDALDMALGRGGDQTVVCNSGGFLYFGGRSLDVERRNKVKPRLVADALVKLLPKNQKVFIMGHQSADADSIGAAVGLCALVREKGLEPRIILDEPTCDAQMFVELLKQSGKYVNAHSHSVFISPKAAMDEFEPGELLILVDCHKASIAQCPELFKRRPQIVIFDHHRLDADFISNTALTYHEPYVSSTCEMVVEILQYIDGGIPLLQEEVQCLYAGIVLDTKNFTFKTGVRTFEAASYLRSMGVDTVAVKRMFQVDFEDYMKKTEAVAGSEIYRGCIAIAKLEDSPKHAQVGACADDLLNISGIDAGFALCQKGEMVDVSARSLAKVNVQLIMETLGGGGHATSAGGQIKGSMAAVLNQVKQAIDEVAVIN